LNHGLPPPAGAIREAIGKICARFDDAYWLKKDKAGGFPTELHQALARDGWLGIAMPEEYGGSGLGIAEAAVMMQAISDPAPACTRRVRRHMNVFGLNPWWCSARGSARACCRRSSTGGTSHVSR
jgi:acyl-CoA dehydrogenase